MPRWTSDQQAAIEARKSNLLVSAAAGSGKTAVLVERIIQLIMTSHIGIDEMLIVTFTNAAASEMRERIVSALYNQLEKEDDPFLREQVNKIQKASIMTLHAFCIGVVRNNAHFIDVDPGFKVGDTVELNILAKEVMDLVLEEAYEEAKESFHCFIESYSENREDKKIQSLINSTYRFIQSQPDPIKWLNETVEQLSEPSGYVEMLKANIKFDLEAAVEILESASILVESPDGPVEYDEMIQNDLLNVSRLVESLDDLSVFVESVRSVSHMRLKAIKKARKEEVDMMLVDEIKALRQQYKDLLDEIKSIFEFKTIEDYLEDIKAVEPMMAELARLVSKYQNRFSIEKMDKNIVDFNDLEHLALKALESEDVRKYYQKKYAYIFLDEYQDSNLVQETLINRIKRDDNVFLVGDVKQSIYKFRLADPTLFMQKYHTYSKVEGPINRRIDLKKNFRSRREILEGINFIFESLMSESFGEMVYDDDAKLYTGIEFKDIEDSSIKVNIIEGKYAGDDLLQELSAAEVEARSIANEIKNLVGKQSYDRKNDCYFDLEYRHMVILMRAISAWAPVFSDVFMKEGIPLFADFNGGYFDAIEVKMFVDLLRLIDNPYQDLPLLTVLRSPIFDFTTDDLIEVKIQNPKSYYYESFFELIGDDLLSEKIKDVKEKLSDWQQKSRYMRLDELLWHVMMTTGYYQYVGAMPGGKSRQGNLRLLIDRAEQMEKSNYSSLYQFVETVDKMHKSNADMGTAKIISESENVVRIMSIHKSKGLEFPVVIVAAMGKKFNLRDAYAEVLLHKTIGIGPKLIDPIHRVGFDTLPKKLIKRQIKFESLAEEMRVLYVALTRAVDKLILVGTAKNIESQASKWVRGDQIHNLMSGQSYMDWLMMILSKHPVSKSIWTLAEKSYLGLPCHDTKWTIEIQSREVLYKDTKKIETRPFEEVLDNIQEYTNESINQQLFEKFNEVYPYNLHELPSKFSVTELKRLEQQTGPKMDPLNTIPKFLLKNADKTAAEIGTLTHFIMQKLDRHNDDIESQIESLKKMKVISEEDLTYVKPQKYYSFFNSDLGKRYKNAINVEKEKAFVLKKKLEITGDDEILIQGIIDCYFEEANGIVLIDYKTDYLSGDESVLVEKYHAQLSLYKEAIERITEKKVLETYIYSFHKDKGILVDL